VTGFKIIVTYCESITIFDISLTQHPKATSCDSTDSTDIITG